jgi:hypothetical protein
LVEWLRGWAISLATLALLAGIADALTPQGSMRKYVRVALSMVILAHVLNPVLYLVQRVRDGGDATAAPDIAGPVMAPSGSTERAKFLARTKWQVETMVASVQGVTQVSARVYLDPYSAFSPAVSHIEVDLKVDAASWERRQAIEEALKALLAVYLNVGRDHVSVKSQV